VLSEQKSNFTKIVRLFSYIPEVAWKVMKRQGGQEKIQFRQSYFGYSGLF